MPQGVMAQSAALVAAAIDAFRHADQSRGRPAGRRIPCVWMRERAVAGVVSCACRIEVPAQDISLLDAVVGEKR